MEEKREEEEMERRSLKGGYSSFICKMRAMRIVVWYCRYSTIIWDTLNALMNSGVAYFTNAELMCQLVNILFEM